MEDPPKLDIFCSNPDDIEIDPSKTWLLIEARNSYFEARRHIMTGLQKLANERFPLSQHLAGLEKEVAAPRYIQVSPSTDMNHVFKDRDYRTYKDYDLLDEWPQEIECELDPSQRNALQHILTSQLAVVQGPPGTGKTHVSKIALETLVRKRREFPGCPPIVVACQTNHALDQMLRHVKPFANFIRLGARSDDELNIKIRTLSAIRQNDRMDLPVGCKLGPASQNMRKLQKDMSQVLGPLESGTATLDTAELQRHGILTPKQHESLAKGLVGWQMNLGDEPKTPMQHWVGDGLVRPGDTLSFLLMGHQLPKDPDLENIDDEQAEMMTSIDKDDDLDGEFIPIKRNGWVWKPAAGGFKSHEQKEYKWCKDQLQKVTDLWDVKMKNGPGWLYTYFRDELKSVIRTRLLSKARAYASVLEQRRIGSWERDVEYLTHPDIDIIGLTTTGLSKYRGLLNGVQPTTIMIEEAAETLEAPVTAACLPSLQHLILVGDHKQLQPRCDVDEFGRPPFNLNISLFERLVNNDMPYRTLQLQRRMAPQISRLLQPIYGSLLKDNPIVEDPANRPPVPGMGDINTFFWSHSERDSRDDMMSSFNSSEADMVVGLYTYLHASGTPPAAITILTFYNAQRRLLVEKLRKHYDYDPSVLSIKTVDSFQGEENEVVILSLVRSGNIGFMNVENRICVALSRAKRGFYIIGVGEMISRESELWMKVMYLLFSPDRRCEKALPVTCARHGVVTNIGKAEDWKMLSGGCSVKGCPKEPKEPKENVEPLGEMLSWGIDEEDSGDEHEWQQQETKKEQAVGGAMKALTLIDHPALPGVAVNKGGKKKTTDDWSLLD